MLLQLWMLSLFCFTYGSLDNVNKNYQRVNGSVVSNQTLSRADGPYLVTSDLVVAQNATLTIEAGTEVRFVPNVGVRVHGSLHAKGTPSDLITFRAIPCKDAVHCNGTNLDRFYKPGIRLVDGTSYNNGRLEIQRNGQWGTICDRWSNWDFREMGVACRQLGFLGAKRTYKHPGSGPVYMSDLSCKGNEESLWDCRYYSRSCFHDYDVGLECDTLIPLLVETVYWKGIYFAPSNSSERQGNSSLENADIVNAFEGIKALKKAPDLINVTVRDGASGLLVKELENHLGITGSTILRSRLAGINIESSRGKVVIDNVTVQDTRFGDGLVYKRIEEVVDFCSIIPGEPSFPFVLNASGKALPVNCSQVFRAQFGRTLTVHFRLINGSDFELSVTDGRTENKTLLSTITDEYNGKTIKIGPSSVLELSFYSKGNSKVPANLEMIIVEDQGSLPSLTISNSNFSNNFKTGIRIYDLMGHSQISSTVVSRNGDDGLHISEAYGKLHVVSSVFEHNTNRGVHIEKMSGSMVLQSVRSLKNQKSGIIIFAGTLSLFISDCYVDENSAHGLFISKQLNSTVNISNTQLIRNSGGEGIHFQDFSEGCKIRLSDISSLGNSQHGAHFERVKAISLNVTSSSFDENTLHGVYVNQVLTGNLNFKKISTSNNLKTGIFVIKGGTSVSIESWTSISNHIDGFYLESQEGQLRLKDCFVHGNKRNGLWFADSYDARLQSAHLQNCSVLESSRYGIAFYLTFQFRQGAENYTVTVANSTIANNALGGCWLYNSGCRSSYTRRRRVQLSFDGNIVQGNQKFGLYIYGPEWYELRAVFRDNDIKNNSGYAMKVAYYDYYSCSGHRSSPVNVTVLSNTFIKNKGEYTVFVDYNALPQKRHIVFKNNTFLENRGIKSFFSNYVRTRTQAVLAVKEGTAIVEHNSFFNPLFPHEMATLLKDHERFIQARENWWGTRDECAIKERIFDFGDRIELAQVQYYPFLDSFNSSNLVVHNGNRPFCFLKRNSLGGTLNQPFTLPKDSATYQVTSDVIVLPKGVLTIEENVTLEFPLQAIFIVYGQVVIKGTKSKRVKFIPKTPLQKEARLAGGPAPWEGRLEIWFNNGWMPVCISRYYYESTIVCRQLGYEAGTSIYRSASGNEKAFIHNVRCNTDENDSIVHCNRNNWISSSSCSNYVAYILCKTPYWAGVHLTVAPKKSDIKNFDISYAGFAYRNDLSIPGIALRVDLSHHNISEVFVDNSPAVGLQIMYPDPFKISHDIMNATITNTESDGIRLETPFLNLMTTNVVNTKGYGFLYNYNWNPLNSHVFKMADTTVKKNIHMCSENNTFIDDSSLVYYLLVTAESSRGCEMVITVPQDYSIGMQLIHHDISSYEAFHVYNGLNKTSSTLWDIHILSWSSRPAWKSNSSSVLLEWSSRFNNYRSTVHFLLFLIKDTGKTELESANLIISKSNFISNAKGGIYLGGEDSGNIEIQSSVVQDSLDNGLMTRFSTVKSLNLFNCSFIGNKVGVTLSSFSGNVNIENTKVSNTTSNALYIVSDGKKSVHLLNSSVTYSKGYGIYLYGNYEDVRFSATKTFFGWNKDTSIYSKIHYSRGTPGIAQAVFKNCTFLMNQGPVINIDTSPQFYPWEFEGNVFMNNTQSSVIMTTRYTDTRYSPGIFLRRNKFLFNFFQEKGVIYIKGGAKELIIDGNVFEGNEGRSVYVEEQSFAPCTVKNNVFKDNNNSNEGVMEIRRTEKEVLIVGNIFKSNEGLFAVLLHLEYNLGVGAETVTKNVTFMNNTLVNNTKDTSRSLACEVNISGLMDYKTISIHYNRFNSKSFSKELCVNIFASSHATFINASLNFWGCEDESEIKERIFDAEDNYEYALAVSIPFLDSKGNVMQGANQGDSLDTLLKGYLGGRISSALHLPIKYSPYKVTSDLTILPDARLTIHPGVEVQFGSGVGMLILGSLFVLGNRDHPVTFSLLRKNQTGRSILIRLKGGTFPWIGRLEVLQNGNWTPVCVNRSMPFARNNAKVVCEQLGYQAPSSIAYAFHVSTSSGQLSAMISCNGDEKEIDKCSLSFHNRSRNSSRQVVLNCSGGTPWGNLRFTREHKNTSYPIASNLQYLKIEHCGEKHGKMVAAIETIQYLPEMNHLSILNCTAGGVKVLFPEREVYLKNTSLVNTGGNGSEILITKRNVALENVTSINNKHGLNFIEPDGHWMDGLTYGQVMPCSPETTVSVKDHDLFLYLRPPYASYSNPEVYCQMVVKTDGDAGLAVQLLVMKNMRYITIKDPNGYEILKYSARELSPLSRQRVIPWNTVKVLLGGWYSSEMILQVQRVENKDIPCTFERGSCNWKEYPGSYFKNIKLNWKWKRTSYGGIPDHTYSYSQMPVGNLMVASPACSDIMC
ncbi:protein bark beetle-like [Oculina patagonica]